MLVTRKSLYVYAKGVMPAVLTRLRHFLHGQDALGARNVARLVALDRFPDRERKSLESGFGPVECAWSA